MVTEKKIHRHKIWKMYNQKLLSTAHILTRVYKTQIILQEKCI